MVCKNTIMKATKEEKHWLCVELARIRDRYFPNNASDMAREMGVDPSQLYRWTTGQVPRFDQGEEILKRIKKYKSSPLPLVEHIEPSNETSLLREDASEYGKRPQIIRGGAVSASDGSVDISYDPSVKDPLELHADDTIEDLCWSSNASRHCDPNEPILQLIVRGDSMAPEYTDGSWLYIGKPRVGVNLPDTLPVVMHNTRTDEYTFKVLMIIRDVAGDIVEYIGLPFTQSNHTIVKMKAKECEIFGVAMGAWKFASYKDSSAGRHRRKG